MPDDLDHCVDLLVSAPGCVNASLRVASDNNCVEHVRADCPGLRWEPNGVVEPELTVADGSARLRLGPHPDDADQRAVSFTFDHVRYASIGFPNDEGRPQHRLWRHGLSDIHWIGKVEGSQLIAAVNQASALPSRLTHWVLLLKEGTAEVVAESLEIRRE